jgi:hypothetical protein
LVSEVGLDITILFVRSTHYGEGTDDSADDVAHVDHEGNDVGQKRAIYKGWKKGKKPI